MHHYVPVFLLKRWSKQSRLFAYKKIYHNNSIYQKLQSIKTTSCEPCLNTLEKGFSQKKEEDLNRIENSLNKYLDMGTSKIIEKLINKRTLKSEDRKMLINFLLTLPERNPIRLKEIESDTKVYMDKILHSLYGGDKIEDAVSRLTASLPHNSTLNRLNKMITPDKNMWNHLGNYGWVLIDTEKELLTSTKPVILNLNRFIQKEIAIIEIAISPKKLFLYFNKDLKNDLNLNLIRDSYNKRLLSLNPKYVYSKKKYNTAFLKKYWE